MITSWSADRIVDPAAVERGCARFGSAKRLLVPVEATGDASHPVLAGDILSPQTTAELVERTVAFLRASD